MEAHGEYHHIVIDGLVLNWPVGSFNEQGVERSFEHLKKTTEGLTAWVLLEFPNEDSAMTPEALHRIFDLSKSLSAQGCLAIFIHNSSIMARMVHEKLIEILDIPVFIEGEQQVMWSKARDLLGLPPKPWPPNLG